MITNPHPDGVIKSALERLAWSAGECAGQSNVREAMRCETCRSYLHGNCCNDACPIWQTVPPNFGCIHHQAKG